MPDGGSLIPVPGHRKVRAQQERKLDVAPVPPTRYALALRRQAANRIRQRNGKGPLPQIGPGGCGPCGGWGVTGPQRARCARCGGSGQ